MPLSLSFFEARRAVAAAALDVIVYADLLSEVVPSSGENIAS